MHLMPSDTEKLLLAVAGMVARDRRERGVLLNHPETVALLSTWVIERAREGASVTELMQQGREVLTAAELMPGVAEMIDEIQVEATFPDGRKLVTLHHPVQGGAEAEAPGAFRSLDEPIEINARADADRIDLVVTNTGDRPVQIGSHFHLADTNPALDLDRLAARGFRLDVPAGTSVRFEPGVSRMVSAVRLAGTGDVPGLRLPGADA